MTSNQHQEIILDSDQVRVSLPALANILESLDAQTFSVVRHLEEAQRGDPHKYLSSGISEGFDAGSTSRRAAAELRDVIDRVTQTLRAFDQHDQGVHIDPTTVELPAINGVPATLGLTNSDMSPVAMTTRSEDVRSAMDGDGLVERTEAAFAELDPPAVQTSAVPAPENVAPIHAVTNAEVVPVSLISTTSAASSAPIPGVTPTPNPSITLSEVDVSTDVEEQNWLDKTEEFIGNKWGELERFLWDSSPDWFKNWWNSLNDVVKGILRGVFVFVLGLLFVALVSFVVLLIAAILFGVAISWKVFLVIFAIVGVILLVALFIIGVNSRFRTLNAITNEQSSAMGFQNFAAAVFLSGCDVIGLTGIYESFTGREVLTQRELSTEERSERATIGVLIILSFIIAKAYGKTRVKNFSPETSLKALGVPEELIVRIPKDKLPEFEKAIRSWNTDGSGKNQGVVHVIDYPSGKGGPDKLNRLIKLEEYTREGPFDVNDPEVLIKVTKALDNFTSSTSSSSRVVGDKNIYFVPKDASPPPFQKSQKGIIIIKYNGKYSTFYNGSYSDYTKLK